MKNIHNLHMLSGPVLVFGGVYSNLQALEALRDKADRLGTPPENIICTGDIAGYCAQPEACIRFIAEWGVHAIAGNVELNLRDEQDDCGCNFNEGGRCDLNSRQWYPFVRENVSGRSLDWLKGLPDHLVFSYAGKKVAVVHGSWDYVSEFVFESTDWTIKDQSFLNSGVEVILAGHCGIPFTDAHQGKLWLNAGVIGMPANDGTPDTWYLLLDDRSGDLSFRFKRLTYDYQLAASLIRDKPLPQSYADTLVTGIWDNCEILPEEETRKQGKRLDIDRYMISEKLGSELP